MGLKVIDDEKYGYYIWEVDGVPVGDDEGRYMLIQSRRGDQSKIQQITAAARYYGVYENGKAVFCAGRPISDEEYEEQRLRMKMGLTPDPMEDLYGG